MVAVVLTDGKATNSEKTQEYAQKVRCKSYKSHKVAKNINRASLVPTRDREMRVLWFDFFVTDFMYISSNDCPYGLISNNNSFYLRITCF